MADDEGLAPRRKSPLFEVHDVHIAGSRAEIRLIGFLLVYRCLILDEQDWALLATVTAVCVPTLVIAFLYREKIEGWLTKRGGESL